MADGQSKIDAATGKVRTRNAKKTGTSVVVAAPMTSVDALVAADPAATLPAPADVLGNDGADAAPKGRKPLDKLAASKPDPVSPAPAEPVTDRAEIAQDGSDASHTAPSTTLSQLKDKIMATAANTDFTAKIKDTAADMQTRAKSAYEKGAEMTSDMTAFTKDNYEALVASGKVLAAGMQDMGRTAVEDAKVAAETVTADVKRMVAVKSPTELMQLQGEIARRNLDAMVAKTSKNAEVMTKLVTDMFAPISTRASVAMERFNKAA